MMPGGERFRPSWQGLQPGDPWTFITADPIQMGIEGGSGASVGAVIEWLPDDGPALLFYVDEIASVGPEAGLIAYSCTHIPQPLAFREKAD